MKGRCVYNRKPMQNWLTREDTSSPTAALESVMLTSSIDAKEECDVITANVPNAFIQTVVPEPTDGHDRIIMKITRVLADYLLEITPEIYGPYVVMQNGTSGRSFIWNAGSFTIMVQEI